MNTSGNYPESPARNSDINDSDLISRLKANKFLLIVSAIIVVLIIYLIIRHRWVLWLYVVISLLFIVGVGVYKLLSQKKKKKKNEESVTKEIFKSKISSLENQNTSLKRQVTELESIIHVKDSDIEQLKSRLENTETDFRLEYKYSNVLVFFQFLDRSVDYLPECVNDFKIAIHKQLEELLETYGYRFLDFEKRNTELYDCGYYPIEAPDLVRRTIIYKNGKVVSKGKIYLPDGYDSD